MARCYGPRRLDAGERPKGVVLTNFRLDKWYFDCVSADGTLLVGYAAKLRWGPVGLNYGARIKKSAERPVTQRQSLSSGYVGDIGDGVNWSNDAQSVSGSWLGGRRIESEVLLDDADGHLEWECLGANSKVSVFTDGVGVEGLGYAERISMTMQPWRLPFQELRWGRYVSDDGQDFAVWIDVRGKLQRNWTWMNSSSPVDGTVNDDGVQTDAGVLGFEASQPIRHENVARTLLGVLRPMSQLLPKGVRRIQEAKQLSSGLLTIGGRESRGCSINEVVKWL